MIPLMVRLAGSLIGGEEEREIKIKHGLSSCSSFKQIEIGHGSS
jgi:hypothetical protein